MLSLLDIMNLTVYGNIDHILHVSKVVNYLVTWFFCNTSTSQSQVDEVVKQSFVASNNGKIILLSFLYLCYFYVIYYLLSCYCRERNIFAA